MIHKKMILVVDDDPDNFEIMRELFGDDYNVATATDGWEAIHMAADIRPDIILLDVKLPGMDGVSVCRKLRALRALWNNRIIILSGMALPSERLAGINAGADAYMTKPFEESELRGAIRRLLDLPWDEASSCNFRSSTA